MEAKLKALKVVQLKEILSKASIPLSAKANKQDLISKIIASPPAISLYNSIYNAGAQKNPSEVSSKPPPQTKVFESHIESTAPSEPSSSSTQPTEPSSARSSVPTPATQNPSNSPGAATQKDDELERRKQRAARFGIPLVELKQQKSVKSRGPPLPAEENEKLAARANRFGLSDTQMNTESKKRSKPTESVDPEELERRKKRAERFGVPVASGRRLID